MPRFDQENGSYSPSFSRYFGPTFPFPEEDIPQGCYGFQIGGDIKTLGNSYFGKGNNSPFRQIVQSIQQSELKISDATYLYRISSNNKESGIVLGVLVLYEQPFSVLLGVVHKAEIEISDTIRIVSGKDYQQLIPTETSLQR